MTKQNKNTLLSEEDIQLWYEEIKDIKKLKKQKQTRETQSERKVLIKSPKIKEYVVGVKADKKLNIKLADNSGINYSTVKRMDKGDYPIDGSLDLHGFSINDAFEFFFKFINTSYYKKHRMLLVVTGKGLRFSNESPSINKMLQRWINVPGIIEKILRYNYAIQRHGGKGAYYILLKK